MATKNAQWKRLDKLLDKALSITNSDAVPCLSFGTKESGWTCFRAYRAARIDEEMMCHACALHWNLTRAQTLFVQMKRATGTFT